MKEKIKKEWYPGSMFGLPEPKSEKDKIIEKQKKIITILEGILFLIIAIYLFSLIPYHLEEWSVPGFY